MNYKNAIMVYKCVVFGSISPRWFATMDKRGNLYPKFYLVPPMWLPKWVILG